MGRVRAFLDLTRMFPNQIMIGLGVIVGEVIASSGVPPLREAVLGFVGPMILGASTFAMNDCYDLESDRRGGRVDRPLVRGDISLGAARAVFLAGFPAGLLLSSVISFRCLLIAVAFSALALAYNLWLKETGLPGNLFIASTMGIPFVYGSVAIGGEVPLAAFTLAMMAFLSGAGREVVKDIMDMEADEARSSRSLPRTRGIAFAGRLSASFFIVAVCLSPLPFISPAAGSFHLNLLYLIPVMVTDAILLAVTYKALLVADPSHAVPLRKLSLVGLNIGLVGFLLGSF